MTQEEFDKMLSVATRKSRSELQSPTTDLGSRIEQFRQRSETKMGRLTESRPSVEVTSETVTLDASRNPPAQVTQQGDQGGGGAPAGSVLVSYFDSDTATIKYGYITPGP